MAKLYFRYGAMNSGKTTAIMQVAHNYEERWMRVLLIKPAIDTKWWQEIMSRLNLTRKVDIQLEYWENIEIVIDLYQKKYGTIDCILVDEAQFLNPWQVDWLFRIATTKNIPVICYGLRSDFLLQPFPASERLLILAHTLEELKTICRCGKKAIFNMRIQNNIPVFSGEQIMIDRENEGKQWEVTYESVCANCYLTYREKSLKQDKTIKQIVVKSKTKRVNTSRKK